MLWGERELRGHGLENEVSSIHYACHQQMSMDVCKVNQQEFCP